MKTNFYKGLLMGLIVPMVAFYFYVTLVLHTGVVPGFKQLLKEDLLTQVIAINVLANIIPLFVFNKRGEDQALEGVVGASLLYAISISLMYFL